MLSRRPLLYLTIPSLALLIGLWFRRKKAIAADSGGGKKDKKATTVINGGTAGLGFEDPQSIRARTATGKPDISDSVPIGGGSDDGDASSLLNTSGGSNSSSNSSKFGKSAPITIGPNSRSPPIPIANKPGCGHTSDDLNSIDEFDVESSGSPVDLPGSYERRNFEFVKNSHLYQKRNKGSSSMEQPIKVITASKSPKISPKNAFSEATNAKQQPKSPQAEPVAVDGEDTKEESLIISSRMAMLSLDDSVNNNKHVEAIEKATPAAVDSQNNNVVANNKEQESTQEQPPTISSPPLSLYSVHSNDSGKGSSPTQSEAASQANNCYEFLVHERYVGLLIGRSGNTVKKLNRHCGVHMIVRRAPNCPKPTDRVCAIMGAQSEIEEALKYIRKRLSLDKFPDLSLERVFYASSPVPSHGAHSDRNKSSGGSNAGSGSKKPVMPIHYPVAQLPLSLSLVEGINNDVVISAILNGGHVFLQQPSHPTFQQLQPLHALMAQSYAMGDSPVLEAPEQDAICVAPVAGSWYRVVIVSSDVETQTCLVKFLDFGGFVTVPTAELRQIRTDFMTLPFQSIEVALSNLAPVGGEWSPAAAELVFQLSSGRVMQAQVAGYTPEGLPEIFLYAALGPDNIAFINQELVAQGFAVWMEDDGEEEEEQANAAEEQQSVAPVLVQ